jgi:molybdopterin-containing oxidoreductase family membrane subunit
MTDMTADVAAAGKVTRLPLDYPALRAWWVCFGVSLALLLLFFISAGVLLTFGVGVWGNNIPVNWSLAIANYIWFLGIGHAGTLISALLLLLDANWRNSLNRFAEAMTLFAVICAGLYPICTSAGPGSFTGWPPTPTP